VLSDRDRAIGDAGLDLPKACDVGGAEAIAPVGVGAGEIAKRRPPQAEEDLPGLQAQAAEDHGLELLAGVLQRQAVHPAARRGACAWAASSGKPELQAEDAFSLNGIQPLAPYGDGVMSQRAMSETGDPDGAIHLLVHPERFPSNDLRAALAPEAQPFADAFADLDRAYGRVVAGRIARARRAIRLLDPAEVELMLEELADSGRPAESLDDLQDSGVEIVEGVAAREFELIEGDAFGVEEAVQAALSGKGEDASVLVGGFARADCVRRAIEALGDAGHDARECPLTTMPLPLERTDLAYALAAAQPLVRPVAPRIFLTSGHRIPASA